MPSSIYAPSASVNGTKPNLLRVRASLTVPWRMATVRGEALSGRLEATMDATQAGVPVFVGEVDRPDALVRDTGTATARGLPAWRREVGPMTFQDVRLETLLTWLAGACGGRAQVQARGAQRRHYVLRRGPAHQLAREALTAWRCEAVLIELDGETLYIGAEDQSPHATAGEQFDAMRGQNITGLTVTGPDYWQVRLPLMPHLRVGHRGQVEHPLITGAVRITDLEHQAGQQNFTQLEVTTL